MIMNISRCRTRSVKSSLTSFHFLDFCCASTSSWIFWMSLGCMHSEHMWVLWCAWWASSPGKITLHFVTEFNGLSVIHDDVFLNTSTYKYMKETSRCAMSGCRSLWKNDQCNHITSRVVGHFERKWLLLRLSLLLVIKKGNERHFECSLVPRLFHLQRKWSIATHHLDLLRSLRKGDVTSMKTWNFCPKRRSIFYSLTLEAKPMYYRSVKQ